MSALELRKLVLVEILLVLSLVLVVIWVVEFVFTKCFYSMMLNHAFLALITIVLIVSTKTDLCSYGFCFSKNSFFSGVKIW